MSMEMRMGKDRGGGRGGMKGHIRERTNLHDLPDDLKERRCKGQRLNEAR
jgi:hypothetical protein